MKVKNASYLRSLTALLRSNIKNCLDERCKPWYVDVPSLTYIWTRRPQWRRRHKNRKKSKSPRFPMSSNNSRINEQELLDTFKIIERPISRSSASPYETCSSKQIITESELSKNYKLQKSEFFNFPFNRRDEEFDFSVSVSESISDTGLRKLGERQMDRLIRSQNSLGGRNSANYSQASSVRTFSSSLEVNRSIRLSIDRELQSDCSIPKRRVTFSNYVSENSATDTSKSRNNTTIMNDNEACKTARWWQESYVRFTDDDDDDDDDSLKSDLSRFFSSIIFDVPESSISLTSSKKSVEINQSKNSFKKECTESVFYVNSSYLKKSSCDLLSVKKICSNDNNEKIDKLISNPCNIDEKELELTKLFIKNDTSLSNQQIMPEEKIEEMVTDYCDIDCITVELKDITSNDQSLLIGTESNFVKEPIFSPLYKNHISTDTNDLNHSIELHHISSLSPIVELSKNDSDKLDVNFSKIIDFFQRPRDQMDAIILKEFTRVDKENFGNYEEKRKIENVKKIEISNENENLNKSMEKVDLLRIDTETYGEFESVFIELKDLDDTFEEEKILKKSSVLKIGKCSQKARASLIVNLPNVGKNFEPITSTGSNFRNGHGKCTGVDKCCLICGRNQTDNPRYLRPVCRVKGANPTPRLENDPWINVMKKVIKYDRGKELIPRQKSSKKEESHQELLGSSRYNNSNTDDNSINTILPIILPDFSDKISENVRNEEEECFSVIITEAENSLPSISTGNSNISSSRDDPATRHPDADMISPCSFDFATRSRIHSRKSYYMRESVRTVDCTANRLLCVISESDSLMGLPQFLPKKPPDWFGRQVPRRKWSRR